MSQFDDILLKETLTGLPHDTSACYCVGPQNGQPKCPCRMREDALRWAPAYPPTNNEKLYTLYKNPQVGWICPKCEESNAPFMPTCMHCAGKTGAKS